MMTSITLGELLPTQHLPDTIANLAVGDLRLDSRLIKKGDIFICINAVAYIDAVIAAGASAILGDSQSTLLKKSHAIPVLGIDKSFENQALIAARRYAISPSMSVMGVTGTNGKSTLVSLVAQLMTVAGHKKSATLGTLGYGIFQQLQNTPLITTGMTTPDVFTNYRALSEFSNEHVNFVAMEVSSHGLSQGRVDGLPITTAVFTNLTQDHLDYHGTFSAYAEAKKQLFTMPSVATAIVNADDANAELIINAAHNAQVLTYALVNAADVQAKEIVAAANGTRFTLITPWGHAQVKSPLLGVFNIYNLLAAITVVLKQGVPLLSVVEAIQYLQPVAGRMQQLPIVDGIKVIVDFAHTPDGLEQALLALRDHIVGRIWVVFGCGGDRDKQKRALMGAIAEDLADEVILTSDNPRSENPQSIISDIAAGCKNAAYQVVDRQEAIAFAIEQAQAGDCVLIAGKGHETYQLIQNKALPFCDVTIANALLQQKNAQHNHAQPSSLLQNEPQKNQSHASPLLKEAK